MDLRRLFQIIRYGWKHSAKVAKLGEARFACFLDILSCYRKYRLWSNQYLKEKFWTLNKDERERIGNEYKVKNLHYEEIKKDKLENRIFLNKWKSYYWELGYNDRREKRQAAYAKRYNMGKNCDISFDVHIERNHFLEGKISIGNNVLLSKHVYIDYSGGLVIKDNVSVSNGVIIETHEHPVYTNPAIGAEKVIPKTIIIEDGVIIGARAIIHASVGKIGRNARVGADAVLRQSVPPYAIVMGNPSKIVGFSMTPEQVEEYEREKYHENERISIEKYTKDYNKLFLDRIDEIKQFLKKSC